MSGRSLAIIIGSIGGVLVLLGGLVTFLLAISGQVTTLQFGSVRGGFVPFLLTGLLGVLILVCSRPRLFWWPGRRLFNAVLLILLGAATWILVGGFVLTAVGALLAIVAGVLLPIEGLLLGAFGGLRRGFRRKVLHKGFW